MMPIPNPRRFSLTHTNNSQSNDFQTQSFSLSSFINFFKKPLAFPFLLSAFLFLTWVSLRLQHSSQFYNQNRKNFRIKNAEKWSKEDDLKANLVRFVSGSDSFDRIMKDKRGWLLDPVKLARDSGLKGGALSCASAHIGEIRPGTLRGNHRHHTCNETFVIWGAKTRFRMENSNAKEGYAEVIVGADAVAVATSPTGTAHALINIDPVRTSFFLGCQDETINYSGSTSDFNVWKDL